MSETKAKMSESLINLGDFGIYNAETLYMPRLKWSCVKLLHNDNKKPCLMATSHLIEAQAHLPEPFKTNATECFMDFDTRKNERAMLVRDVNGDFAIVKGTWVGSDRSHVDVEVYFVHTGCIETLEVTRKVSFEIKYDDLVVKVGARFEKVEFVHKESTVGDSSVSSSDYEGLLMVTMSIKMLFIILQSSFKKKVPLYRRLRYYFVS